MQGVSVTPQGELGVRVLVGCSCRLGSVGERTVPCAAGLAGPNLASSSCFPSPWLQIRLEFGP